MIARQLDHIAIVVADFDATSALLEHGFGLRPEGGHTQADLRTAFFACGDVRIELIDVFDEGKRKSRLQGDPAARIEHIAFEVEDLSAAVAALEALGIRVTAPPRTTARSRSVWTVPDTSGGVMYQFSQTLNAFPGDKPH